MFNLFLNKSANQISIFVTAIQEPHGHQVPAGRLSNPNDATQYIQIT